MINLTNSIDYEIETYNDYEETFFNSTSLAIMHAVGLIPNLALLVVLLVRLVRDIQHRNIDKARWAKRHTLIAKCFVHTLNMILLVIVTQLVNLGSSATCQFVEALNFGFILIGHLYSIVIVYQTLLQLYSPTALVGPKQMIFWLIIHLLIWIGSLVFCGALIANNYEWTTVHTIDGEESICIFVGTNLMFSYYSLVIGILPLLTLLFLASVTSFGLCCASPPLYSCLNNEMHQRLARTRLSAALFIIILAVFSCVTLLPIEVLNLMHASTSFFVWYMNYYKASYMLRVLYYILFPVCCLILEESWLCYAIDRQICSRQTSRNKQATQSGVPARESELHPL